MPGFSLRRDATGLHFQLQGCCGNIERDRRMYERAFYEQLLREGGQVAGFRDDQIEVIDRKGRSHLLRAAVCLDE